MATPTVKLSEHRQNGRLKTYKKIIGGKNFYLSLDRSKAERMALALMAAWSQLRSRGFRKWTEAAIFAAMELAGEQTQATPTISTSHGLMKTLHAAIDEYLEDYKKKVSASRHQRQLIALREYKLFQSNVLLDHVTWDVLNSAVNHYRRRPVCPSTERQMTVATVQTQVKALFALFDWLDMSGRWEAPRRFDRIFKVNYKSLRTLEEINAENNSCRTFSIDELKVLWKNATQRQRLYLGLALNIGETAQGLADLKKNEIRVDGSRFVIDRNRRKTGVRGSYILWPEVAQIVKAEMNTEPSEPLAFKTLDGNPLVWFLQMGRCDSVARTWNNLLKKSESVPKLGFKFLRKTGATIIENVTGSLEIAQMYLSHVGRSVAERHYLVRNFDRLHHGLDLMRQHLAPVFDQTDHLNQQATSRVA